MPTVFVVGAAAYVFGDTLALCGRLRWEKEVDSANGKKSYLMKASLHGSGMEKETSAMTLGR